MDAVWQSLRNQQENLKDTKGGGIDTDKPLALPSDLVNDNATTAHSLDLTSLQTSKHHPDFRVRNQHKVLKLATILSDLHLHLSAAQRTQDQPAFDDLCARITKAGEGLSSLAQPMPAAKTDCAARKMNGRELSDVCKSMKDSEWYHVEHGSVAGEGEKHDSLSSERIERARDAYEAGISTVSDDVSAGKIASESLG